MKTKGKSKVGLHSIFRQSPHTVLHVPRETKLESCKGIQESSYLSGCPIMAQMFLTRIKGANHLSAGQQAEISWA